MDPPSPAGVHVNERRKSIKPAPQSLRAQLNLAQSLELSTLERFGWQLWFIRKPLFQEPVAVVVDVQTGVPAVLTPDGELDEKLPFKLREER